MRLPFGLELRKRKNNINCLHPQVKVLTEFAFDIEGKEYWTFKNLLDMPAPRYQRCMEFIREAEMRITSKELMEFIELIKDALNKGKITDAIIFLNGMDNLTSQFIETDTYYRLFTCIFFDLDEDITDYDFDYNEIKIKLFKAQPQTSFFFTQPMKAYLPQIDISEQDLAIFLKQTKVNQQYLQRIKAEYMKSM